MSFDGIMTNAVLKELNNNIIGARVDKIYQPENDELVINLYNNSKTHKLLISANNNRSRFYLSKLNYSNPVKPPMFCMLLRKHLTGGIIEDVIQVGMDRVIEIIINARDEIGNIGQKKIIIELMGKHSNIILVNNHNIIIDSIKRVYPDMSSVRQVLPSYNYESAPASNKINILSFNFNEFEKLLAETPQNTKLNKFPYFVFEGLSPLISNELCYKANIDPTRVISSLYKDEIATYKSTLKNLAEEIKLSNYSPMVKFSDTFHSKIETYYCFDITYMGNENIMHFETVSEMLDYSFNIREESDKLSARTHSLRKLVRNNINKLIKKMSHQKEELLESKNRDIFKVYADLISVNIYKIKEKTEEIELNNFYSENNEIIKIPINVKKSISQNADFYYKKYSKLKNAEILLSDSISEIEKDIDYLENTMHYLENVASILEIEEIKAELIEQKYLLSSDKNTNKKKKKKKTTVSSEPYKYISSDGFEIYVGKNSKQNEFLSLKLARRHDIWMHIQAQAGSHVIIRTEGREVPDPTMEEAAFLAAYFSRAKDSNSAIVDWTEKSNVNKMKNGKPGMVNYRNFKSINIAVDPAYFDRLKLVEDSK